MVILENVGGHFAAIQILNVQDENADGQNALQFSNWILPDGADDFSVIDGSAEASTDSHQAAPDDS